MILTVSYGYPQFKAEEAKIWRNVVACPRSPRTDESITTIVLGLSPTAPGPGDFCSLANKAEAC